MKTDLDHLPESKRRELERAVAILFEEFEAATATRSHAHRRNGKILKIILFGSYARGDWVADPVGGYISDYDLLVVVDHDDLTDILEYWREADERLTREVLITKRISAPVNFIVHSLKDVNKQLQLGRYFFTDILSDGIALYDAPGHPLDRPMVLSALSAFTETQTYFSEWLSSADDYFDQAKYAISRGKFKVAAFELHQATERLYSCLLLVLTLYSPKSHKLNFLRSQAEQLAPALAEIWPRNTRSEQRSFELLRRAYVDARYSPNYKITTEELAWLTSRIELLQAKIVVACTDRIKLLKSKA